MCFWCYIVVLEWSGCFVLSPDHFRCGTLRSVNCSFFFYHQQKLLHPISKHFLYHDKSYKIQRIHNCKVSMACNYDCSIDDWLEIRVSRDRFQRRVKSSQLNVFSNLFAVMWPPKQDEEFAVKYFFLKLKSTVMDTTIRLFRIGEKKRIHQPAMLVQS